VAVAFSYPEQLNWKENWIKRLFGSSGHLLAVPIKLINLLLIKVFIGHVERAGVALPWMESWSSDATMNQQPNSLCIFGVTVH